MRTRIRQLSNLCGGEGPPLVYPAVTIGVAANLIAMETASISQKSYGGVKLDLYDGTTCLETFLAAVKNFAVYYQ